ncbi:MAG: HAD family hydrolase [Lachnospiraceae bacterium]|nr:HAD family hydrolase [Lachnospiraceae bacterium]
MEKRKYDTVIFDLDGTLLNTLEDLADSVNYVMKRFGYPSRTLSEIRSFVGNGIRKLMERSVPEDIEETAFEEAFVCFKEYYTDHCQIKTDLYEGIAKLLARLKADGYKMAIVSNKNQEAVTELRPVFFGESITVALGQSENMPKKPGPEMAYFALEQLGSKHEQALYVGDSDVDKQTADNAGLDCVLVTWGFRDRDELEKLAPFGIIDTPDELWRYL